MINLSVNVNKVATLRNSRGEDVPNVIQAVQTCINTGVQGITVHPREDQRHIKPHDVYEIAEMVTVEYNIEGDPRPDLLDMVIEVQPDQCTLVPVTPGEVTSDHGWNLTAEGEGLKPVIQRLKDAGIRVSLFSGTDLHQIELAKEVGADRIEFYTAHLMRGRKRSRRLHTNLGYWSKPLKRQSAWISASMRGMISIWKICRV